MNKRTMLALMTLLLCLLAAQACAIALPDNATYTEPAVENEVGTAIVDEPQVIEVSEWLGKEQDAFDALVKEKGLSFGKNRTRTDTLHFEDGTWTLCLTEFMLYTDGFSVYGYEIDGRLPDGYRAELEAEGWTRTKYQFEGGLEFITFEKTVGEAVYRFEINACDSVITYLELKTDSLAAHLAAQQ